MPSPADVVPSFRKQAYAIYLALLVGFIIYVVFAIVGAVRQRDNPPIKVNRRALHLDPAHRRATHHVQIERLSKVYIQPSYTICPPGTLGVHPRAQLVLCVAHLHTGVAGFGCSDPPIDAASIIDGQILTARPRVVAQCEWEPALGCRFPNARRLLVGATLPSLSSFDPQLRVTFLTFLTG